MRIVLLAALTLIGCTNSLDPWERNEFRLAERKWNAAGIEDYRYEMRTSCFCPPEDHEWAVVEVRNNQVVSARGRSGSALRGGWDDARMAPRTKTAATAAKVRGSERP